MKERRKSGATHSFRLTREASDIVDNLNHPRNLGGKSRLISDAIVYYFGESKDITIQDLIDEIDLQAKIIGALEQELKELPSPSGISDDEADHVPPWWGKRLFRALFGPSRI